MKKQVIMRDEIQASLSSHFGRISFFLFCTVLGTLAKNRKGCSMILVKVTLRVD
jgi:hypothetical protein